MKKLIKITLTIAFLFVAEYSFSQLELIGQYKARGEFSNGYNTPLDEADKVGGFINQRARLGVFYGMEKLDFTFVAQDVRTWGQVPHSAIDNQGALSIFEANVGLHFSPNWSLKIGRQPISYDNQRIFGALDWPMQARRHDAAIVTYKDSTWQVDVGGAYNQMQNSNTYIPYTLNNYHNLQYVWAHKDFDFLSMSFLFLNNGIEEQYEEDGEDFTRLNFSQTAGMHFDYLNNKIGFTAYGYYQFGKDDFHQKLSAFNASLAVNYLPSEDWKLSLGAEYLSGNDLFSGTTNHAFTPFYGTSHGFNGAMDYFYSGNHINSVGLMDVFFNVGYKIKKWNFQLNNHAFMAAAAINIVNGGDEVIEHDKYLGYEMDFSVGYQFIDEVNIQLGFSQMIHTESMRVIKGVNSNENSSNWAYLMITVHPFKNINL